MYADDTTIYFNTYGFPNDHLAKPKITELDKVDVWLKHDKFVFKCRKNKRMTFHTCLKNMELIQLFIHGFLIEHVKYFNF